MMGQLLKQRVTLVWLFMMALTLVSWSLGSTEAGEFTTLFVMGIAFIKVRLVIFNFMEVRDAPLALRLVCDFWVLGVVVMLLRIYTLH